ncbi:MAG: MOP flippase family protein, partial [Anaerolineae bacterium]
PDSQVSSSPPEATHDLKDKTVTGVLWNTVARAGQQAMQFGLSVILARLLLPDDFGAVGMVMVIVTFMSMAVDAGFAPALVQRTHISESHLDSVFWFNVVTGVALCGLFFAGAPLVAAFYREPSLAAMTRGLSAVFVLSAAGLVPAALMQRRLQFHLVARISLIATFVSGVTGVVLAFLGAGVWSLVVMYLASFGISTVLNLLFSGWHPGRAFRLSSLRELWGFSGNVLGFNFVNYWARNADNLLVGKYLGPAALGFYSRAYGLMLMPITQVIGVISNVMLAALSTIQQDRARVKSIFLRAVGLISLLVFPMMIGLLVVAEPFVRALFGENWAGMIPTVQILALVGVMQALSNPTGWLYLSQGRTDWYFRWGVVRAVVLVGAIVLGVVLGTIEAVAACYAVANLLLLYLDISIPGRLVGMTFRDLLGSIAGPLAGATVMGLSVYGLGRLLPDNVPQWQQLALLCVAGVLIYGAFVVGLRLSAWLEAVTLLREWLGRRSRSSVAPGPVE